jgi:hypothetical protein
MRSRPLVLAISLCLIAGGLFFTVRAFRPNSAGAKAENLVQTIQDQAKREVPEPALPPAPSGSTVTTTKMQVLRNVPTVKLTVPKAGEPAPQGPRSYVEQRNESVDIRVAKGTAANAAEVDAWNREVAALQQQYNAALNAKIAELAKDSSSTGSSASDMEAVTDLVEKAIVPLISAITGLILAIKSLRSPKESPSAG